jgi:hypothetical protein
MLSPRPPRRFALARSLYQPVLATRRRRDPVPLRALPGDSRGRGGRLALPGVRRRVRPAPRCRVRTRGGRRPCSRRVALRRGAAARRRPDHGGGGRHAADRARASPGAGAGEARAPATERQLQGPRRRRARLGAPDARSERVARGLLRQRGGIARRLRRRRGDRLRDLRPRHDQRGQARPGAGPRRERAVGGRRSRGGRGGGPGATARERLRRPQLAPGLSRRCEHARVRAGGAARAGWRRRRGRAARLREPAARPVGRVHGAAACRPGCARAAAVRRPGGGLLPGGCGVARGRLRGGGGAARGDGGRGDPLRPAGSRPPAAGGRARIRRCRRVRGRARDRDGARGAARAGRLRRADECGGLGRTHAPAAGGRRVRRRAHRIRTEGSRRDRARHRAGPPDGAWPGRRDRPRCTSRRRVPAQRGRPRRPSPSR